jgi:hypothetical protein
LQRLVLLDGGLAAVSEALDRSAGFQNVACMSAEFLGRAEALRSVYRNATTGAK